MESSIVKKARIETNIEVFGFLENAKKKIQIVNQ